MSEWREDTPDWTDDGKEVLMLCDDGRQVAGRLSADEFFPDGQGDEIPCFVVILRDGRSESIWSFKGWRFA